MSKTDEFYHDTLYAGAAYDHLRDDCLTILRPLYLYYKQYGPHAHPPYDQRTYDDFLEFYESL